MNGIFVAIVNFRTGPLVVDCLASLVGDLATWPCERVIVVDNDSGDESPAYIQRAIVQRGWAQWVEVLVMPRNGGFAYGNNAAIARIRAIAPNFRAAVLLNPDTIVMPGAIERLAAFLNEHRSAGIVGPMIEDATGRPVLSAHADPSPLNELLGAARLRVLNAWFGRDSASCQPATEAHACDWLSGACLAIRREVFDSIGPLDEGFFLYFEEVDFCMRARRAGWHCRFNPEARIRHLEGASTGIGLPHRRRPAYWYASRRRFFVKAYGIAGLVMADLLWATGRLSLITRRSLGLGGRVGRNEEPRRFALDLLGADLAALVIGDVWRIAREVRSAGFR